MQVKYQRAVKIRYDKLTPMKRATNNRATRRLSVCAFFSDVKRLRVHRPASASASSLAIPAEKSSSSCSYSLPQCVGLLDVALPFEV